MAEGEDFFEINRVPVGPGADLPPGVTVVVKDIATYSRQQQEQTLWCWVAVASSVAKSYDADSPWTQCRIVDAEFGETTCCVDGNTRRCNRTGFLYNALKRTNHFLHSVHDPVPFSEVVADIEDERPIGVRIAWPGGSAHAVAISGYQRIGGEQFVVVGDPAPRRGERSIHAWATFRDSYLGRGRWTRTDRTQR